MVWHTAHPGSGGVSGCSPAQSAAVTAIPGIVFSGGLDGHVRAYAAMDGKLYGTWTPSATTRRSTVCRPMAARSTAGAS